MVKMHSRLARLAILKMAKNYHSAILRGHTLPGHTINEHHSFQGSILDFNVIESSGLTYVAPSTLQDGKTLAVFAEVGGSTNQHPPETPWYYNIRVLVEDPVPPDWIARFFEDGNCTGASVDIVATGTDHGIRELNYLDDNISSCIVKPGYKVIAYNGPDYSGRKMIFSKDPYEGRANCKYTSEGNMKFTSFPAKMNDSITSIYCMPDP